MSANEQQSLLRKIARKAKSKGTMSFAELAEMLTPEVTDEETKKMVESLQELGIKVQYPVDSQTTTATNEPDQRNTEGLLTREQEVDLARKIRKGQQRRIRAALRCPKTINQVVRAIGQVAAGKRRPWDVLADFEGSHPDEDVFEALERLERVAERLRQNQNELNRLLSPQAARKNISDRKQRVATIRASMTKALNQLDLRDLFINELMKPICAEGSRVEQALKDLRKLEKRFGLVGGSLGGTTPVPDNDIRELLRSESVLRDEREWFKREVKKKNRIIRSACHRTGLDCQGLRQASQEIIKGELEANRARQQLVEANQRLVISIARRYPHHNMDFLDLVQEGNLGLMRAADRFDPERGFRFGTYAAWWVRQSIGRLVAEQGSAVRIPPHVQESLHKVNRITRRLVLKTGKEPRVEELAECLGKTPERVKEILSAGRRPISTETQVGDDEDSAKLLDFIPDPNAGPDEEADRRVQQAVLQDAMSALTEREQNIIILRFQRGLTLQEVGDRYGITRERTRQLEAQALRKLRKRLKADLLRKLINDEPFSPSEDARIRSARIRQASKKSKKRSTKRK